jgi:hypothetical protein
MSPKNSYVPFTRFVFRVPTFSVNAKANDIFISKEFNEAIYLASPDLYDLLMTYNVKSYEALPAKLRISILKYILRSKTRCTPFGLFAGCGVGRIKHPSKITLQDKLSYKSTTRIDMTYLHTLTEEVSKNELLQEELIYYPNDSLYKIDGLGYRYIEYKYLDNQRKYFLSQVEFDDELEKIIAISKSGLKKNDLASLLVDREIGFDEAKDYVDLLIDNQLLVPEFCLSATGNKEMIQDLIIWLKAFKSVPEDISFVLKKVDKLLLEIDNLNIGREIQSYNEIENELLKINIPYNRKYLFQSDLSVYANQAFLGEDIIESVRSGLTILNKLTSKKENLTLKKFKNDFFDRYEREEIPLIEALDVDTGIHLANISEGITNINPLIDDLGMIRGYSKDMNVRNYEDEFLLKKYHSFLKNDLEEIVITEEDVAAFSDDWSDLPDTLYSLIEVVKAGTKGNDPLICIKAVGGSSAANLLGRFCHSNSEIHELVKEIITVEDNLINPDQLLAEIVHLPQFRTGNITYRPNLRKHQITLLTRNSSNETKTIDLSDLMISMPDQNSIILRSKSLNKQILPRLTTAHNFSYNSIPLYHFLCLLQLDEKRGGLHLNWGNTLGSNLYLPRIIYKNIIFSLARWNIPYNMIKDFSNIESTFFHDKISEFKKEFKIPNKVFYLNGDTKMLIDFDDWISVQALISEIREPLVVLEEYLFEDDDMLINDNLGNGYINEVILGFKKR